MKKLLLLLSIIFAFQANAQYGFTNNPADSVYTNYGGWSLRHMYQQKDSTANTDSYFFKSYHKNFHFMNNSIKRNAVNERGNFLVVDTITGKISSTKFITFSRVSGFNSSSVTTALGYTPQINLISGTNIKTINGVSILGSGNISVSSTTPTYNYGVSRTINSSSFTPSTTQPYRVTYNVSIACTATIGSAASGKVELQYYNGSTWVTVNEIANSNTVTLAIVLNSVNIQTVSVSGEFPANTQLRLVPTVAGTTTITYIRGTEILY